jgi:hypothetical protein
LQFLYKFLLTEIQNALYNSIIKNAPEEITEGRGHNDKAAELKTTSGAKDYTHRVARSEPKQCAVASDSLDDEAD